MWSTNFGTSRVMKVVVKSVTWRLHVKFTLWNVLPSLGFPQSLYPWFDNHMIDCPASFVQTGHFIKMFLLQRLRTKTVISPILCFILLWTVRTFASTVFPTFLLHILATIPLLFCSHEAKWSTVGKSKWHRYQIDGWWTFQHHQIWLVNSSLTCADRRMTVYRWL